jgi:hypothetical protein
LEDTTWNRFGELDNQLAGNVEFFGSKGDTLVAGAGANGYVWYATDTVNTWTGVQLAPLLGDAFIIYSVVSFNGVLYAGSTYGIHRSTDGGLTWNYCGSGIPNNRRIRLIPVGNTLYATVSSADTRWYKSVSGESWEFIESTFYTYAEAVINGKFFVGRVDGLWRRDIPTSVSQPSNVPFQFALEQNYPNPFNPTTTINYQLLQDGLVVLKVYDILGREVVTLFNKLEEAGFHSTQFDANGLTSGIYFYRLQAGQFTEMKKLILLR